jgi:uncharacterized protein (TIGR02145 family)
MKINNILISTFLALSCYSLKSQVVMPAYHGSYHVKKFTCGDNVTFTYNGSEVTYGTVESNGRCWIDRNLGASQVAVSSTDAAAYGDLFQWGRLDDGHQIRTSGVTSGTCDAVATDTPPHSNFIKCNSNPYDWRNPQNDNLWQGVSGINNPCPSGWRVPTEAEWNTERLSWVPINSATGAINSPLKLPVAGVRHGGNGSLMNVGSYGYYWSSTADGIRSKAYILGNVNMTFDLRVYGFSVRCIKDCHIPEQSTQGTHNPSETHIIWNWNTSESADGYKHNTVNDYTTATDNGTSTSYTQEGLDCETECTLYVWAYNACGASEVLELTEETIWSCGCDFIDPRDGIVYSTVQIGSQCWMAENLAYLPSVHSNSQFSTQGNNSQPGYGVYGYDGSDVTTAKMQDHYTNYGVLYNWFAVNQSGVDAICPTGWHVASRAEWTQLTDYIIAQGYPNGNFLNGVGNVIKSCRQLSSPLGGDCSTSEHPRWDSHATHYGTDVFGFSSLPGGFRVYTDGKFYNAGVFSCWWASTDDSSTDAWSFYQYYNSGSLSSSSQTKKDGYSVRCIKH